jgi:hypothetical protein
LLHKAPNPSPEVAGRQATGLAAVFLSLLGMLLFAAQAGGATPLGDALASTSATGTQAVASATQPVRTTTAGVEGATAPATKTIEQTSASTLSTVAQATSTSTSTAGQVVAQVGATTTSAGQVVQQIGATTSSADQVVRQLDATAASAGQVVSQVGSGNDVGKVVGTLATGAGEVTQASSAVTETLHTGPASTGTVTETSAAGPVAPGGNGPRANGPSGSSMHPLGAAPLAGHAGPPAWTSDPRLGLVPPSSSGTPAGTRVDAGLRGAQRRCAARGSCAGARTSTGGASDLLMLSASLPPAALGLDRDPAFSASATGREFAPPLLPRPEPSPTPGGIPLAGAAGSGFAVALLLALSLLLGAPPAMRRLRLAGERWGPAPLVLILERPD